MWYIIGYIFFRGILIKFCFKNKKIILGDYRNFDLNFYIKFNLFIKIIFCINRIFFKENI